jgi:hypothetical protein
MDRKAVVREFIAAPEIAEASRRWIEAWASHVRKRFNSRAVIRARVPGMEPMTLSQVYALEGGGLVLVMPCLHADHGSHPDHGHDDGHGEGDGAAKPKPLHTDPGGGHDDHPEPPRDDHAEHPHGDVEGCCGDCELWLSSEDQVVFEARCAPDGELCTGFGYLGLSRTPLVLVARGTKPPPPPGHDHHGNF